MNLHASLIAFASQGGSSSWPLFLILGVVWIFVLILPARKEKKRKEEMMASLKKGDQILLSCGLVGKIASLKGDDMLVLDVDGTKMTFLKSSVTGFYVKSEGGGDKSKSGS
jgi:preprotein translocase subunit YajC